MAGRVAFGGTNEQIQNFMEKKFKRKSLCEVQWLRINRTVLRDLDEAGLELIQLNRWVTRSGIYRDALMHFLENTMEKDFSEKDLREIAFYKIVDEPKTAITIRLEESTADRIKTFFDKWKKYKINISDIATEAFFRYYYVLKDKIEEIKNDPVPPSIHPFMREDYLKILEREKAQNAIGDL